MQKSTPEPATPKRRKVNRGWFKPGQPGPRLTHGLYTDAHPAAASIVAEVERFMGAQLADEGGPAADLTARRGALVAYRGRIVHKNILKLSQAIEDRGLFDQRGKLRVAWLQQLGALLDKAVRLDALLGLQRRTRRVQTPIEWLESLQPANDQQHQEGHDDANTPDADQQPGRPTQSDAAETQIARVDAAADRDVRSRHARAAVPTPASADNCFNSVEE
jgi:hypothetical protein